MRFFLLFLSPLSLFANSLDSFVLNSEGIHRAAIVVSVIVFIYLATLIIRNVIYRYTRKEESEESNRQYIFVKKALNISFALISLLILGVAYSENFAQSLAIFGVVGAGLTIVLKEVVLSMVAWVVLMTGSMIRLGDRIKIEKVNNPIIGDVVDISLTKITLYENITNDSVTSHKRAGRIIFVPNYLIFTSEIYNYTHLSMKTIIDLVEINFSFDSNFGKAETITREVVENISGRYADMAKRQYDKLKSRYTLRNMPTYPRIVFYPSIQGDGVTMAIWYIAPYREILNLKSEITKQCITQLNAQEDIKLIYSSASVYLESNRKKSTFGSVQI